MPHGYASLLARGLVRSFRVFIDWESRCRPVRSRAVRTVISVLIAVAFLAMPVLASDLTGAVAKPSQTSRHTRDHGQSAGTAKHRLAWAAPGRAVRNEQDSTPAGAPAVSRPLSHPPAPTPGPARVVSPGAFRPLRC